MPDHHQASCSPDGRFVVAFGLATQDSNGLAPPDKFTPVQLLSASSGELLHQFKCAAGEPYTVAFSPDNDTVAVVFGMDNDNVAVTDKTGMQMHKVTRVQVRLLSVKTGEETVILDQRGTPGSSSGYLYFSPDGTILLVPTAPELFVFTIREGAVIEKRNWPDKATKAAWLRAGGTRPIARHPGAPYIFMPDGTNIIIGKVRSGSHPGPKMASLETGEILADWNFVKMHHGALSPDGEVFATTCEGHSETAFIYSTKTGDKLGEVSIESSRHIDESVLDFSPDGTLFLAGRDLFKVPTLEKLPTPPTLATRCQIGEFTQFYGPDGFSGDGRSVVYSNFSGGNLCLVNVPDGSIKWCWHHGRLVKARSDPPPKRSSSGGHHGMEAPPSSSSGAADEGATAVPTTTTAAAAANMVTIDGYPGLQFQVLDARRDTTVGGGDAQTSWHARLRYTAPTAAPAKDGDTQIQHIEFFVSGSELNSERHDRESHTVSATLSPMGEHLTLYDSSYYEKYSSMQSGPGNAKDASDAGREKLAACLSSLLQSPGASSSSFISAADVLSLALALDSRASAGSLPGTVKTHVKGPDDDGRYDNCAPS